MNRARRRALQLVAALPFCVPIVARADKAPATLGYLPWWMAPGWQAIGLQGFERIVLFGAAIGGDGAVERRNWQKIAPGLPAHAQARGIGLELALTLLGEADFEGVFAQPAPRERLLGECVRMLDEAFLAGLHLDIEGYSAASAAAISGFRAWLAALHQAAAAKGKTLSAFFPASDAFLAYDAASAPAALHGRRREGERPPYYAYPQGERWVQGWYEDVASLTHKLGAERSRGYAGLAFFPLGYDNGEIVEPLLRWWRSPPP